MPIRDLKDQIAKLPEQPGVYVYLDRLGVTIYVGKARSLRQRVRSYLSAYGSSSKTNALLDETNCLEVIVTDSVVEALALETNLIKHRLPKYNILLRDDKNYPYLQLTTNEDFPRVLVARNVTRDGNFYAGPFLPASFARKTMNLTHRLFGIRSCNEVINGRRGRPCLEYDIKRCVAPCVSSICSPEEYAHAVKRTQLFLDGNNGELLADLKVGMGKAAAGEHYEQAAQFRDAIRVIEKLANRQQKIATVKLGDRDVFGVKVGPCGAVIQIFEMRAGKVVERVELLTNAEDVAHHDRKLDIVQASVQQFYEIRNPPREIHLPVEIEESEALERWLSSRIGKKVRIVVPKRGEKRLLVELVVRNATLAYESRFGEPTMELFAALEALRTVLRLPSVLHRIECFDISTIQGNETVGSMVVCEDGRMKRSEYRKYRVRGLPGNVRDHTIKQISSLQPSGHKFQSQADLKTDDFSAMQEVILRRYRRLLEGGGPFPDLIVIDGGKGQLSAAYAALNELGLANLVAIAIVKKKELIITRDRSNPLALARNDQALLLIQRMRDEAHRFAVTFHRKTRVKNRLRSVLDEVPGVGPKRRQALLIRFGSLSGIRLATRKELVPVVGLRIAQALRAHFALSVPGSK